MCIKFIIDMINHYDELLLVCKNMQLMWEFKNFKDKILEVCNLLHEIGITLIKKNYIGYQILMKTYDQNNL